MSRQDRWVFDANYQGDPFENKCTKKMGKLHTTFTGYGTGILEYGGCGKGRVEVYLNDERIDFIGTDETSKLVEFQFSPYSKLELRETEEESAIDLISLQLGCRGILYDILFFLPQTKASVKHSCFTMEKNSILGIAKYNLGYRTECKSPDEEVGQEKKTPMQCAVDCRKEVAKKEGKTERDCEFIDHGFYCCSGEKKGYCWHERGVDCDQTSMHDTDEDNYSLYKIERLRKYHQIH